MDYMERPAEVEKHPNAAEYLERAAAGNVDALAFLWTFWNCEHMLDDLFDSPAKVDKEMACKTLAEFLLALLLNPFVLQHRSSLAAMLLMAFDRELVADRLSGEAAEVIRCTDYDMVAHVAYLVGGWSHMREISNLRKYD